MTQIRYILLCITISGYLLSANGMINLILNAPIGSHRHIVKHIFAQVKNFRNVILPKSKDVQFVDTDKLPFLVPVPISTYTAPTKGISAIAPNMLPREVADSLKYLTNRITTNEKVDETPSDGNGKHISSFNVSVKQDVKEEVKSKEITTQYDKRAANDEHMQIDKHIEDQEEDGEGIAHGIEDNESDIDERGVPNEDKAEYSIKAVIDEDIEDGSDINTGETDAVSFTYIGETEESGNININEEMTDDMIDNVEKEDGSFTDRDDTYESSAINNWEGNVDDMIDSVETDEGDTEEGDIEPKFVPLQRRPIPEEITASIVKPLLCGNVNLDPEGKMPPNDYARLCYEYKKNQANTEHKLRSMNTWRLMMSPMSQDNIVPNVFV